MDTLLLVLSGFLLGIGIYLRSQNNKLRDLRDNDKVLQLEEERLKRKIEEIEKKKNLNPKEIEDFWNKK